MSRGRVQLASVVGVFQAYSAAANHVFNIGTGRQKRDVGAAINYGGFHSTADWNGFCDGYHVIGVEVWLVVFNVGFSVKNTRDSNVKGRRWVL